MEVVNVREYDVNVPYQDHSQFGRWSQPASISVIYRADQALRNQRVKDVRDAVKDIEQTIDETLGIKIPISAESGYASAYDALRNKDAFDRHVTDILSKVTTLSETVREGTLKVVLMAESLQVGMSAVVSFSMTVNRAIHTWVTFDDGSQLQITLKLGHELGEGLQINVTTTVWGKDKDGNDIPLHDRELTSTEFGTAGINPTSLTKFFALLGVKIVYSHGSFNGGGGSCETKWKCSSDGKTCTLEVRTSSCSEII